MNAITDITLLTALAPLVGGLIAGLAGKRIGHKGAHWVTILGMSIAFLCSLYLFIEYIFFAHPTLSTNIYTWGQSGSFSFYVGFLVDHLTVVMLLIVNFVSLVVHIYSVGYMRDDPGYQRFFCYMSVFTFFMIMLVLANNFLQLFFGWEGVGLVSYLLIGFWFKKESAAEGSLKAFIVNRVGDFGFILGIAAILDYFGTLSYKGVFAHAASLSHTTIALIPHHPVSLITVICVLLFIGAMGKSAQLPLHVWLPESMEGPTPISALIHAATMVTAGVYMVARMSPLYELSAPALSLVLIVGASGALFLGILALAENDIKRVIAYSTMSQLGYMMAANGASAFSAGIFHLVTHACFKALLFLSAGSVIVALHHEQDLRKMGNLRKYLPVTYVAFLIGGLALAAFPPFSGFYSKDAIIEAVHRSTIFGSQYSYYCLLFGALVTALYTFRAFFLAFHGKERFDAALKGKIKESPWVMLVALVLLAIPATILGALMANDMLYAKHTWLSGSVYVASQYNVLAGMAAQYHGALAQIYAAFFTLPFWFVVAGILITWFMYVLVPKSSDFVVKRFSWIHRILLGQYGFDKFNDFVFVRLTRSVSQFFYQVLDLKVVDGWLVNGSARGVNRISRLAKSFQTGYLYHYVFVMIVGLLGFLGWLLFFK